MVSERLRGGNLDDRTTHVGLGGCHGGRGSDVVETANDAKSASGPCDGNGDLDANI